MAEKGLTKDRNSYAAVQTHCPVDGQNNLRSGTYKGTSARCGEDGDLTFNFPSGNSDTIACYLGDDYAIRRGVTVTIDSGMFHIM